MAKPGRHKSLWSAFLRDFGAATTRQRDGKREPIIRVWLGLEREPDRGVTLDLSLDAAEKLAHTLTEQVEQVRREN